MKLTKPQIAAIITPIITLIAGYIGYEPIQELRSTPEVKVEVNVPAPKQQHTHKDWTDAIEKANKRMIFEHRSNFH